MTARTDRMTEAGDHALTEVAEAVYIVFNAMLHGRRMTEEDREQVRVHLVANGYWSWRWWRDASRSQRADAPEHLLWWGRITCFDEINDDPLGD